LDGGEGRGEEERFARLLLSSCLRRSRCGRQAVLSPLLRRGERKKKHRLQKICAIKHFMDGNSMPTALLMAGGIALAMLPTLFGRKGSGDSEVLESLLSRVNHLRQGQFPVRYRRLSVVEARAKLLAEAREGLDKKSFFRNQLPT